MATVEEIFENMRTRLESLGDPKPLSWTEFMRNQELHVAENFGLGRPSFRTTLDLRFHGRAVELHDLDAKTGTSVVEKLVDLVEEAGSLFPTISRTIKLYFSPVVLPGSTIITLFGEPRRDNPSQETLATGIADTSLDVAMKEVFKSINIVSAARENARPSSLDLTGPMGKRLFNFSKELLSQNVELDLTWTKPSGKALTESITWERASHIKTVLDVPVVVEQDRNEVGRLEQISIDGTFKLKLERDRRRIIELTAPISHQEELRSLWGKQVRVAFHEKLTSHPQRDADEPEYEFISIVEAPESSQGLFDSE